MWENFLQACADICWDVGWFEGWSLERKLIWVQCQWRTFSAMIRRVGFIQRPIRSMEKFWIGARGSCLCFWKVTVAGAQRMDCRRWWRIDQWGAVQVGDDALLDCTVAVEMDGTEKYWGWGSTALGDWLDLKWRDSEAGRMAFRFLTWAGGRTIVLFTEMERLGGKQVGDGGY